MKVKPQLPLFAKPPLAPVAEPEVIALAARLPQNVRLGPSTWTFPGWANIVYQGEPSKSDLVDEGLHACARYPLFRTVSIDQSYYAPPTAEKWREFADALPDGFKATPKLWAEITRKHDPRTGELNPQYLNVGIAKTFIGEFVAAFGDKAGPVLLQFPPMLGPDSRVFCDELAAFVRELPTGVPYAIEIRNRELLTPRYARTLKDLGVSHTFSFWSKLPPLRAQLDAEGLTDSPIIMARLNLPPGMAYEDQRQQFAPFNRIVTTQPQMRDDIVELWRRAEGRPMFIIANNKAEGSAPLTLRALAERITDAKA